MTVAECQVETMKHIEKVRKYLKVFTDKITNRGIEHDRVKMESPEVEIFAEFTPKLAGTTYGSEEYNTYLKEMKVALDHHYANCRHHPEHFAKGINEMTLVDLIEMLADWKAASECQNNGNILKSIEMNAQRFGYDDQLKQILLNTIRMLEEQ